MKGDLNLALNNTQDISEKKELNHVTDSLDLFLYVSLLLLTIVTIWILKKCRARFIHESGLAVIYGLIVGLIIKVIN